MPTRHQAFTQIPLGTPLTAKGREGIEAAKLIFLSKAYTVPTKAQVEQGRYGLAGKITSDLTGRRQENSDLLS